MVSSKAYHHNLRHALVQLRHLLRQRIALALIVRILLRVESPGQRVLFDNGLGLGPAARADRGVANGTVFRSLLAVLMIARSAAGRIALLGRRCDTVPQLSVPAALKRQVCKLA